jgi:hypothetical protein
MVEDYRNKHKFGLAYFIKNNIDSDFYVIKDGRRKLINDEKTLKLFLKQSKDVRIIEDKGDVLGVSGIWKFNDNNTIKEYLKINAINSNIFEKLLVVNIWNTKKDLFIKVRKSSNFLYILRNKKFEYLESEKFNNSEILMMYSKYKKITIRKNKEI